jgi:lysophospholipase L1-like esterase
LKIKVLAACLALVLFYLIFAYNRVYRSIGVHNLQSPYSQNSFTIENPGQQGEIKYVAIGDSLTAGVGSDDIKKTYVYMVASNLAKDVQKVDVLNLGEPGATTKDVIQNQLQPASKADPDYISLLIGINDIHANSTDTAFSERFGLIMNDLLTNTKAKIILINLPYLGSKSLVLPPINLFFDYRTKRFNAIIYSYRSSNRVKFVDLYAGAYKAFNENQSFYSSDSYHPSGDGYTLWGNLINAN